MIQKKFIITLSISVLIIIGVIVGAFLLPEKEPTVIVKIPSRQENLQVLSDKELSEVVGQAGGLFLTESFGFTVGPEVTNDELRNLINNKLTDLNNLGDPIPIVETYIAMASVMNNEQVNEFTKIMIEQIFRGGLQELINLCEIAGLNMEVQGYDVSVQGTFEVTFRE